MHNEYRALKNGEFSCQHYSILYTKVLFVYYFLLNLKLMYFQFIVVYLVNAY